MPHTIIDTISSSIHDILHHASDTVCTIHADSVDHYRVAKLITANAISIDKTIQHVLDLPQLTTNVLIATTHALATKAARNASSLVLLNANAAMDAAYTLQTQANSKVTEIRLIQIAAELAHANSIIQDAESAKNMADELLQRQCHDKRVYW